MRRPRPGWGRRPEPEVWRLVAQRRNARRHDAVEELLSGFRDPQGRVPRLERRTGKPGLMCGGGRSLLHVNLSYAGGHAVVALAHGREVGIDAEPDTRRISATLERQVFTDRERETLDLVAPAARGRSALRLWVAKEAILKAVGTGLAIDPVRVEVEAAHGALAIRSLPRHLGHGDTWELVELDLDGLVTVLAVERDRWCGRVRPVVHDCVGCG